MAFDTWTSLPAYTQFNVNSLYTFTLRIIFMYILLPSKCSAEKVGQMLLPAKAAIASESEPIVSERLIQHLERHRKLLVIQQQALLGADYRSGHNPDRARALLVESLYKKLRQRQLEAQESGQDVPVELVTVVKGDSGEEDTQTPGSTVSPDEPDSGTKSPTDTDTDTETDFNPLDTKVAIESDSEPIVSDRLLERLASHRRRLEQVLADRGEIRHTNVGVMRSLLVESLYRKLKERQEQAQSEGKPLPMKTDVMDTGDSQAESSQESRDESSKEKSNQGKMLGKDKNKTKTNQGKHLGQKNNTRNFARRRLLFRAKMRLLS